MFRRILLATASALGLTGAAAAADFGMRAPPPPAYLMPSPAFTWTGIYGGVNIGGAIGTTNLTSTELPTPVFFGALPFEQTLTSSGVIGGGQIGYNYQTGPLVFGIETDFQGSSLSQTSSFQGLFNNTGALIPGSNVTAKQSLDWFGTVRGRAGITLNRFLVYASGGLIYGDISTSLLSAFGPNLATTYTGTTSNVRPGWIVGGGIAYGFTPNWSLRAEGFYFNFGNQNFVSLPIALNPPFSIATRANFSGAIGRVGLDYKFNWWTPPPVVSKY